MNRSAVKIALLVGGLTLSAAGCAAPSVSKSGPSWMPGGKIPQIPGSGSVSAISDPTRGPAQPSFVAEQSPIAQVGHFTPVAAPADPCGNCPTAAPSYRAPATTRWNAYGFDPQEFICDGGDQPPATQVGRDDSITTLQPEDTVVRYTTDKGDAEIQASNRTCLYAPRFISVRKITGAVAGGRAIGLAQLDRPAGAGRFDARTPGLVMSETIELGHADVARRIDAMRERNRGVPIESVLQPEMAGDVLAALADLSITEKGELRDNEKALLERYATAAVTWSLDEAVEVAIEDFKTPTLTRSEHLSGFTIYDFPDAGRLRIVKLADRDHALPGDVVSFVIRVENVGDAPVERVTLVDNLTTRLEYVEGSQSCSGGAEFEATANNSQSLKLEWKLTDKLGVGESVTMRFQCKVR